MKYDEFIKEVQTRGHMESRQEAEKATQATFRTLAERLAGGEPRNLASQLPPELAQHLPYEGEETSNPFSLEEFLKRVNEKDGGVDQPRAVYHARVVMEVLQEAVTEGRWTTSARSCRTSMPRSLRQAARGRCLPDHILSLRRTGGSEYISGAFTGRGSVLRCWVRKRGVWDALKPVLFTKLHTCFREGYLAAAR